MIHEKLVVVLLVIVCFIIVWRSGFFCSRRIISAISS
jgi:uncharacterized protein YneF (UPF0154 family)